MTPVAELSFLRARVHSFVGFICLEVRAVNKAMILPLGLFAPVITACEAQLQATPLILEADMRQKMTALVRGSWKPSDNSVMGGQPHHSSEQRSSETELPPSQLPLPSRQLKTISPQKSHLQSTLPLPFLLKISHLIN